MLPAVDEDSVNEQPADTEATAFEAADTEATAAEASDANSDAEVATEREDIALSDKPAGASVLMTSFGAMAVLLISSAF